MVNTYRLMSQVLDAENKKFTNEELAIKYQEKQEPTVLAEIFCRNFPQWLHMASNLSFARMDNEDRVSVVLDKLNQALLTFDVAKGYRFTTYANKLIAMELKNRSNYFRHNKRDVVTCVSIVGESGEDDVENNTLVDKTIEGLQYEDTHFAELELRVAIQNSDMTEREKMVCNIILDNPGITDMEIADMMKVHRHTVRHLKIGMRQKVLQICT